MMRQFIRRISRWPTAALASLHSSHRAVLLSAAAGRFKHTPWRNACALSLVTGALASLSGLARATYTYDNAGQLTGVTLPDATTMSYSYDAAHRLVGVTDAKGNSVSYTLDNMGNQVGEQVKDPSGNLQRNISRVYDALNRIQQVTGAAN
jgi:YD repeat-containing protein